MLSSARACRSNGKAGIVAVSHQSGRGRPAGSAGEPLGVPAGFASLPSLLRNHIGLVRAPLAAHLKDAQATPRAGDACRSRV